MSMAVKLVGGIATGALLLVTSQFVPDRQNPGWTAAAVSTSAQEAERVRASTPLPSADAPLTVAPPASVRSAAAHEAERAPRAAPVAAMPATPASNLRYDPDQTSQVGDQGAAVVAGRAAAAEARDEAPKPQRAQPSFSAAVAETRPAVRVASAEPLSRVTVAEPAERAERTPRLSRSLRRAPSRRPSLRFASRSVGCGRYCSARNSLPTRRNPIEFRLADRGSR